jgi:hypothetical protein
MKCVIVASEIDQVNVHNSIYHGNSYVWILRLNNEVKGNDDVDGWVCLHIEIYLCVIVCSLNYHIVNTVEHSDYKLIIG